ncbi:MAG: hypothetical protein ACREVG_18110 [Burkholderiales bacterium]
MTYSIRNPVSRTSAPIRSCSARSKERYVALGMDTASSTPEEMAAFMRREQERCGSIIRNANIKIEQ